MKTGKDEFVEGFKGAQEDIVDLKQTIKNDKDGISFSILKRLLLMTIIPVLVMAIVVGTYSAISLNRGMTTSVLEGLRSTAYTLEELYQNVDAGDFTQDAEGNVFKGEHQITNNYVIEDNVKRKSNVDVTIFYGDTRVATSLMNEAGERLIGTKASEDVKDKVLKRGEDYSDPRVVIQGVPYYGYYMPLKNADGSVVGIAFAGMRSKETNAYIASGVINVIIVIIVMLILTAVVCTLLAYSMSKGIKKAEVIMKQLSEGNLNIEIDEKVKSRRDEIGAMTRQMESFVNKLSATVRNIKDSTEKLARSGKSLDEMSNQTSVSAEEISRAIEEISKGASSQAAEIEMASQHIGEMGNVIEEIVGSVDELEDASKQMKTDSDESTIIINELSDSNDKTTEAIGKIGRQVHATNDSVQMIREAVNIITSIAEETSLLSLNASIEAARAGEHGRGFAVVASEIQKLAEQSNTSAKRIEQVIDELLTQSESTVQVMSEVEVIVAEQQQKLTDTKVKFVHVTEGVDLSRSKTNVIQKQAAICDNDRAKVMDVIANLSAISEENAASTEETTASMEELDATISIMSDAAKSLKDLSLLLENEMGFFQL